MAHPPAIEISGSGKGTIRSLFSTDLRLRTVVVLSIVAVSLIWAGVILWASAVDGTLRLPGGGKGLLAHHGFQASFAAAPLTLLTLYFTLSYFLRSVRDIGELVDPSADRDDLLRIIRPHIRSLYLLSSWRNVLWLFMFVGTAVSIAIFRNLQTPDLYWGNDVFNAANYTYGYVVANLFLLTLWGLIYPIAFFYAFHLTLSAEIIVSQLKRQRHLRLNFLHIDKCGGMSKFGNINFFVMMIYLWPLGAVLALHATHRYTYVSLVLGAIGISAAFIVQSVYGIYWISRSISAERDAAIVILNERIVQAMGSNLEDYSAAAAMMQYRDKVVAVAAYPYSSKVSVAVNVLRTAPAAIAIGHFALPYFHLS